MTTVETNKKSNKWIWIGVGAALLFCLCAVIAAVIVFNRAGQQLKEGMKTDPEGAAQAAHAIADYELPPGYQEQVAMDLFVYQLVMIGTEGASEGASQEPMIMLAQFQAGVDPQQMEEQIRKSFEQQSGQRGLTMQVVERKQMTIRGEEVEVVTYEGTDENGTALRQLITSFPGKGGTAMLMIVGDPQHWNQDEINAFVESIH